MDTAAIRIDLVRRKSYDRELIHALCDALDEERRRCEAFCEDAIRFETERNTAEQEARNYRRERDAAHVEVAEVRSRYADVEKCISWGVDNVEMARFLDAVRAQEERAKQAEDALMTLHRVVTAYMLGDVDGAAVSRAQWEARNSLDRTTTVEVAAAVLRVLDARPEDVELELANYRALFEAPAKEE